MPNALVNPEVSEFPRSQLYHVDNVVPVEVLVKFTPNGAQPAVSSAIKWAES